MNPIFIGSGVALITPFGKDGKIDYGLFKKLIEFQILNKTDAIIVCGTTGEGSTLTTSERIALFSAAVDQVSGRVPVIAGTGSNSTSFSQDLMEEAEGTGIDAHLSVSPYYNKASQAGIIKHYYALADKTKKPIIVYNVPTRTGVNIKPETYAILCEHPNIRAVKEADSDISKLQKSISLCGERLDFYCGNDDLTAASCFIGCKGVISVVSNVLPYYTHQMAIKSVNRETECANKMQRDILPLIEALFSDVNPIPVKYILGRLIKLNMTYRLPLCAPVRECLNKLNKTSEYYREYFEDELYTLNNFISD